MKKNKFVFYVGQQVSCVPRHVKNVDSPEVEDGFIKSLRDNHAFVLYFRSHNSNELRTLANAEATPYELLIPIPEYRRRPNALIERLRNEYI